MGRIRVKGGGPRVLLSGLTLERPISRAPEREQQKKGMRPVGFEPAPRGPLILEAQLKAAWAGTIPWFIIALAYIKGGKREWAGSPGGPATRVSKAQ